MNSTHNASHPFEDLATNPSSARNLNYFPSARSKNRYGETLDMTKEDAPFDIQELKVNTQKKTERNYSLHTNFSKELQSSMEKEQNDKENIDNMENSNELSHYMTNRGVTQNSIQEAPREHNIFNAGQEYIMMMQSFIQQLTLQLDVQIKKNKDYEYIIKAQSEKCTRIIEALRVNAEAELAELTKQLDQANKECEHLKLQLERGVYNNKEKNIVNSESKSKVSELEETIKQLTKKNQELEMELSRKEKNVFDLENLYTQLKAEAVAQREINEKLKADYTMVIKKEHEVETDNEKLASRIRGDEEFINKLTRENERLVRKLTAMNNQMEELRNENQRLKDTLTLTNKEEFDNVSKGSEVKDEISSIKSLKEQTSNKKTEKKLQLQESVAVKCEKNKKLTVGDFLKWDDITNRKISKQQTNEQSSSDILTSMPSNKKYMENKVEIEMLQNNLQFFLVEKQRLDKEYETVCSKADKSVANRKKKKELEDEINAIEKDIQRTKHKLREFDAFN